MKKIISILSVLSMLAVATPAFAATISNPLFSNGDTTISAQGGATVSGTAALTVGPNEVCEWLGTQSDPSQARIDTSVGGQLGYQEGYYPSVPFTVKAPPNTSTVFPTLQCAGIYGGIRAINAADNVVAGPTPLGTLRVTAASTGGSSIPSGWTESDWAAFQAWKAAQTGTTGTSTADPVCTEFKADMAVAFYGMQDPQGMLGSVAKLQGFLMSKGFDIQLLRDNKAKFGFFGNQTQGAVNNFKLAHASCN